jgi:hypothetical protein
MFLCFAIISSVDLTPAGIYKRQPAIFGRYIPLQEKMRQVSHHHCGFWKSVQKGGQAILKKKVSQKLRAGTWPDDLDR